ncbi:FAD-dependent monooxygenase [Aldersonia sp. NBC_00410]|uniref:FAD-dependent monooxygenase n=1 Tax=Aldersonia sp. NBC_00410 TaxID=2975954 RepID=UPI00225B02B1|nr:FAD-dependent monooxygenase [Aldersonia sp. NBC_00410]MCX5046347.1 FAD-dependent monooxygenase [Aldersonia sp. NBC_00410]
MARRTASSVLVIGSGIAGSAVAIFLARVGVAVDVVEARARDYATGSGITLQGNALRVLRDLGVWEQVREHGWGFDTLGLRAPDEYGTLLTEIEDARTGGPDLPAAVGMERPELARILRDTADLAGAKARFGTTVTSFQQDDDGVDVHFSDGSHGRYDVVVGADGVRSTTRRALGIDLETVPTGMGIWRLICSRPTSIARTDLYYGGAGYIAGYCPTGEDSMYAYIVEDAQNRSRLSKQEQLETMRELAEHYHGPWDEIRTQMTDPDAINYTWFETHLLDGPWNRGRVVLIGDAAHVCPPTLAQGGAQALEDAAVLAELLIGRPVGDDLWESFVDRRLPRAGAVVGASVQLGSWMLDHSADADVPGLMGRIAALVSEPA